MTKKQKDDKLTYLHQKLNDLDVLIKCTNVQLCKYIDEKNVLTNILLDLEDKPTKEVMHCRDCEHLLVEKKTVSKRGRVRGAGHCEHAHSVYYNDTLGKKEPCVFNPEFSRVACRNFQPRTSPLEVGEGGR